MKSHTLVEDRPAELETDSGTTLTGDRPAEEMKLGSGGMSASRWFGVAIANQNG